MKSASRSLLLQLQLQSATLQSATLRGRGSELAVRRASTARPDSRPDSRKQASKALNRQRRTTLAPPDRPSLPNAAVLANMMRDPSQLASMLRTPELPSFALAPASDQNPRRRATSLQAASSASFADLLAAIIATNGVDMVPDYARHVWNAVHREKQGGSHPFRLPLPDDDILVLAQSSRAALQQGNPLRQRRSKMQPFNSPSRHSSSEPASAGGLHHRQRGHHITECSASPVFGGLHDQGGMSLPISAINHFIYAHGYVCQVKHYLAWYRRALEGWLRAEQFITQRYPPDRALTLDERIERDGIRAYSRPISHTFAVLINALSRSAGWDAIGECARALRGEDGAFGPMCDDGLRSEFAKLGIRRLGPLPLDAFTISALLDGAGFKRDAELVRAIWSDVTDPACQRSPAAFSQAAVDNSSICSSVNSSDTTESPRTRFTIEFGMPIEHNYGTYIEALTRCGRLDEALVCFVDTMPARHVSPSVTSVRSILPAINPGSKAFRDWTSKQTNLQTAKCNVVEYGKKALDIIQEQTPSLRRMISVNPVTGELKLSGLLNVKNRS